MRLLIFELRPPILAEEGLIAALQARLAAVEGRVSGLTTKLNVEADLKLTATVEQALYGIAQESLNNVAKYAQARHVIVHLAREGEAYTLEVSDDGVGIPPDAMRRPKSHGLLGMRERVAVAGGELEFGPRPEGGWRVRAQLPYGALVR